MYNRIVLKTRGNISWVVKPGTPAIRGDKFAGMRTFLSGEQSAGKDEERKAKSEYMRVLCGCPS